MRTALYAFYAAATLLAIASLAEVIAPASPSVEAYGLAADSSLL